MEALRAAAGRGSQHAKRLLAERPEPPASYAHSLRVWRQVQGSRIVGMGGVSGIQPSEVLATLEAMGVEAGPRRSRMLRRILTVDDAFRAEMSAAARKEAASRGN